MLSLQEIKYFIEKLEKLKGSDFEKLIETNLKVLKDLEKVVDANNKLAMNTFNKTPDWYRKDLEWKTANANMVYDPLLYKMLESKVFHFAKDGEAKALEIGPGYGRYSKLLSAWRMIYFAELLPDTKKHIWQKFNKEHHKYLAFFESAGWNSPDVPTSSVNFVFAWDVAVFWEEPYFKQVLKDIWRIMMPGAYAMMQYGNGDLDHENQEMRRGYWAYNTKSQMANLLTHNGFNQIEYGNMKDKASYVIFQKPGSQNRITYKKFEIPLD